MPACLECGKKMVVRTGVEAVLDAPRLRFLVGPWICVRKEARGFVNGSKAVLTLSATGDCSARNADEIKRRRCRRHSP